MKNKVKLRMCGLLFEYDVRLSVKLYFTKSYMNIRTKNERSACGSLFFVLFIKKNRWPRPPKGGEGEHRKNNSVSFWGACNENKEPRKQGNLRRAATIFSEGRNAGSNPVIQTYRVFIRDLTYEHSFLFYHIIRVYEQG